MSKLSTKLLETNSFKIIENLKIKFDQSIEINFKKYFNNFEYTNLCNYLSKVPLYTSIRINSLNKKNKTINELKELLNKNLNNKFKIETINSINDCLIIKNKFNNISNFKVNLKKFIISNNYSLLINS